MPADPQQRTPYFATPKQPRLIWNDRDKRKVAEPLPAQTVEVIRPYYGDTVKGANVQPSLDLASEALPENRLIWTNDNLVALTSLLHGDGSHPSLVVDIRFFSPPDVEARVERGGKESVSVTLTRLTVDLDDCHSTQDAKKRAEIKARIADWRSLIDYWAIDWD